MKLKIITLVLIILSFSACHKKDTDSFFCQYFNKMESQPDSAFSILDSISNSNINFKKGSWEYELLELRAKDLHDKDIKDDFALATKAEHHLKGSSYRHMLRFTYYYQGRIKAESGEAPNALKYFNEALKVKCHTNFLENKIYSQMGRLYYFQSLYSAADSMYTQAYHIATEDKDTIKMAMALRDLGLINLDIRKYKHAIILLTKASALSRSYSDVRLKNSINSYLAMAYIHCENYSLAHKYLEKILQDINTADSSAVFSIAAEYFTNTNKEDSAYYYNTILSDNGTIYARSNAYYFLAKYLLKKNKIQEARTYLERYKASIDTINLQTNSEMLAKVKGLYDYRQHEEEVNSIKNKNAELKSFIITFIMATIIVILLLYVYIQRVRNKKLEAQKRIVQLKKIQNEILQRTDNQILQNEKRIRELEERLENSKKEEAEELKKIKEEYEQLKSVNAIKKIEKRKNDLVFDSLKKTAIFKRVVEIERMDSKVHLNSEERKELIKTFDNLEPNFKDRLLSLCELNTRELLVCLLIKIGKKPTLISVLLDCTPSAISQIRKRLYNKVFNKKGTAEDWDSFILSM